MQQSRLDPAVAPSRPAARPRQSPREVAGDRERRLGEALAAYLLDALAALLRPSQREQIKSPADVAALLMVQMC